MHDPRCTKDSELLGCNALGNPTCRFCGHGEYEECIEAAVEAKNVSLLRELLSAWTFSERDAAFAKHAARSEEWNSMRKRQHRRWRGLPNYRM